MSKARLFVAESRRFRGQGTEEGESGESGDSVRSQKPDDALNKFPDPVLKISVMFPMSENRSRTAANPSGMLPLYALLSESGKHVRRIPEMQGMYSKVERGEKCI